MKNEPCFEQKVGLNSLSAQGAPVKQPYQMSSSEWRAAFEQNAPSASGSHRSTHLNRSRSANGAEEALRLRRETTAFLKMGLGDFDAVTGRQWKDLTPRERSEGMQVPVRHFHMIRFALSQGFEVSQEVLAEYPELLETESLSS